MWKLEMSLAMQSGTYLYQLLYFDDHRAIESLRRVLLGNHRILLGENHTQWICDKMFQVLRSFQMFFIIFQAMIIVNNVQMFLLWPSADFGLLERTCYFLSSTIFCTGMSVALNTTMELVVVLTGVIIIYFTRVRICLARLRSGPRRLRMFRLNRFCHHTRQSFQYLLQVDELYGRVLMAMLISQVPLNVSFIIASIINKQFPAYLSVMLFVCGLNQMCLFLGIHVLAGKFADRLQTPFKAVMSMNLQVRQCPLRLRYDIARNIQTFFVENRYGVHYKMSHSLISVMTFLKASFFCLSKI